MNNETQSETKPLRRVRVVNDGQPGYATKITDADTGQSIDNVYHVKVVDIDVHDNPRVLLWAYNPVIDVTGEAEITNVCPLCKTTKHDETAKDSNTWKIKLDIDDTDVAYAVQRLQDLQREHDELARQSIGPAEAIYAFVSWLMEREAMSSKSALETTSLADKFCRTQGWYVKNENYTELLRTVWEDGSIAIVNDEEGVNNEEGTEEQ